MAIIDRALAILISDIAGLYNRVLPPEKHEFMQYQEACKIKVYNSFKEFIVNSDYRNKKAMLNLLKDYFDFNSRNDV